MSSEEELPTLGQAGQAGSMHEVYEGIYVGNYAAAKHRMFLRKHGISHVLAAAADMGELHPGSFIYKMFDIYDVPESWYLPLFPEAIEYIRSALGSSGKILVHCMNGESRSSTVVAAYLMAEKQMTAKEAIASMRTIRPNISPNTGFLEQLELFERMGCNLKGNSSFHARYRLRQRQEEREEGFPQGMGEYADDATVAFQKCAGGIIPSDLEGESVFSCKKCRKWLFLSRNVITHEQKEGFAREKKTQYKKKPKGGAVVVDLNCTSTFVEPLRWMNEAMQMEGRLECPNQKCKAKLGNFNWVGSTCSCGCFVSPAFQVSTSKVDMMLLKNR